MSGVYEERLFTEQLERLLAGEAVQLDAAADNDLRSALDFAGRIRSLRVEPSPQFRANLKARLLQKLDEREARAEAGNWLARLIRQPVWQAVAVLAFMIVVGGGLMWRAGLFQTTGPGLTSQPPVAAPAPTTTAPMTTTAAPTGAAPTTAAPTTTSPSAGSNAPATTAPYPNVLTVSANTDKSGYQPGELVSINMEWQNTTSGSLTIDEYPPILSIMDKATGRPIYTFHAGTNSITLAPGQKAAYVESWNQLDANGNLVAPGTYYLELEEMYYQGKSVPMTLSKPVSFVIY